MINKILLALILLTGYSYSQNIRSDQIRGMVDFQDSTRTGAFGAVGSGLDSSEVGDIVSDSLTAFILPFDRLQEINEYEPPLVDGDGLLSISGNWTIRNTPTMIGDSLVRVEDSLEIHLADINTRTRGRGTWSADSTYLIHDVIEYNNSTWICLGTNTNSPPGGGDEVYWRKIAIVNLTGQVDPGSTDLDSVYWLIEQVNLRVDTLRLIVDELIIQTSGEDSVLIAPDYISGFADNDTPYVSITIQANQYADSVISYQRVESQISATEYTAIDTQVTTNDPPRITFIFSGLIGNTTYSFVFRSLSDSNFSPFTPPVFFTTADTTDDIIIPNPPSNLVATTSTDPLEIGLAWSQISETPLQWVEIERRTGSTGAFSAIDVISASETSYNDSGLTASTLYNYRIRNWSPDSVASVYSNIAGAFTQDPAIAYNNVIYVSPNGNDNFLGDSPSSAVETMARAWAIAQANRSTLGVPYIAFARGGTWTGEQLNITQGGIPTQSLVVTSYGTGNKPILTANNLLNKIINVSAGVEYVTFENLNLQDLVWNTSGNYNTGTIWLGQRCQNIEINNCDFDTYGTNLQTYNLRGGTILALDPAYLTVDSCNFTGNNRIQIMVVLNYNNSHNDAHNLTFTNNYFYDLDGAPTTDGWGAARAIDFFFWRSSDAAIHQLGTGTAGTTFGQEGVARDVTITDNRFDGMTFGVNAYRDPDFLHPAKVGFYNFTISDNAFDNIEAEAIGITAMSWRYGLADKSIISGNIIDSVGFLQNGQFTTSTIPTSSLNGVNVIQTHGWDNVIIENNIISNFGTGKTGDGHGIILDIPIENGTITPPGVVTEWECDSVIVRNNIIYNALDNTIDAAAGINIYAAKRCEIYNNIIFDSQVGIYAPIGSRSIDNKIVFNTIFNCGAGIRPSGQNNVVVKNNIVAFGVIGLYQGGADDGSAYNYNLTFGNTNYNSQSYTTGVNDIVANPLFQDSSTTTGLGLNILPTSPAINAGTSVTLLGNGHLADFNGNVRSSGNPTIGAFSSLSANPNYTPVFIDDTSDVTITALDIATIELSGTVNVKGITTTIYGLHGTSPDTYTDSVAADVSPLSDSSNVAFTITFNPLTEDTHYFRVSLNNDTAYVRSAEVSETLGQVSGSDSVVVSISQGSDDAWHNGTSMYTGTLEHVYLGNATSLSVATTLFLRFTGITIPAGATITGAWVDMTSYNTRSGNVPLSIQGLDTANVLTFSSGTAGYSQAEGRALTTAVETGTITETWSSNTGYRIPIDLKDIVQEVLDSYAGFSNEAIGFRIDDNGSASNIQRRPYDFAFASVSQITTLRIYYTTP